MAILLTNPHLLQRWRRVTPAEASLHSVVADPNKRRANPLNLFRWQRTDRPTKMRAGKMSHQPTRYFHALVSSATRLAETVNHLRQWRYVPLRFFRTGQITVKSRAHQADNQRRSESRKSHQRAIRTLQQCRQQ